MVDALSRCLEEKELKGYTKAMILVPKLELLEELKLLYPFAQLYKCC